MDATSTIGADTDELLDASADQLESPDESVASSGEAFLNKLSKAILLALGIAVLMAAVVGAGVGDNQTADGEGARLGGDFAAFYSAGSIVWSGDIDSLYDPARQQAAQDELGLNGYLAFAYPPHVAIAYSPLGALDFQVAYVIHTIVMASAFLLAVHLLRKPVPQIDRWRWPLLAASFTFYPLITAVGGGQNASLSVLLLAVIWRALHDDREWLAGLAIGLLIFRPQYAIPMLGLVGLSRHWRAVGTAIATIATTWIVTAAARGADWFGDWWEQIGPFVERDAEVNASNSISFLGFLQAVVSADSLPAVAAGVALSGTVVLTLMYFWANPAKFSLAQRMGAAAIGVVLISPHTMFYDSSLMLIAGAALISESLTVPVRALLVVWVGALTHAFSGGLGATPLALVVAVTFVAWVWHLLSTTSNDQQLVGGAA